MNIVSYMLSSIASWMAWIIIPLVMEIVPACANFIILIKKAFRKRRIKELNYYPEITLIIPIYNSASSLKACIRSIYESDYPAKLIHVLLVNNETTDQSFEVFTQCQSEFKDLSMVWLNAKQGKSKALNYALFNSYGKYIVHIDSDGKLHPEALKNMITEFENDEAIDCMTGTILTDPDQIEKTQGVLKRLFRKLEFFEYCQAFLAGRNFESEFNSIYTVSGAFSAFRKSTILKTNLYNTDTVCEDTHITFQVREILKKRVHLCERAFFYVDPIEDINKLYTQRQRWQRGEIEVSHMFYKRRTNKGKAKLSNCVMNLLVYDHTFAFPRMIWYFALICLGFMNYSFKLILISVCLMYALYVFGTLLFYINIAIILRFYPNIMKYYMKKWYLIFLLPLYNFMVFWFRFAGMINSIKGEQTWRTRNLTEERREFMNIIKRDFGWFTSTQKKMEERVNENG